MIKKAYVIGSKTSESLSPIIFNYWFEKNNIEGQYSYREITPTNFNEEIEKIFSEKDLCGFNVTIPFKEKIINKLNTIDKHSQEIGAVNCVTKTKNGWLGSNTDWMGFAQPLLKKIKKAKNPIVLGYGGAAKAVLYALKKKGFKNITVFNRTFKKIEHLNDEYVNAAELAKLNKYIDKTDLIINTIPTNILDGLLTKKINKKTIAYDLVYKPKETPFLKYFSSNKIYGIDMLIYQAAPCFKLWFDANPVIDKGLYEILEEKIIK